MKTEEQSDETQDVDEDNLVVCGITFVPNALGFYEANRDAMQLFEDDDDAWTCCCVSVREPTRERTPEAAVQKMLDGLRALKASVLRALGEEQ